MLAHQLDVNGVIINTIVVESLDFMEGLVDATIGGKFGDRVVNGVLVPTVTYPTQAEYLAAVDGMLAEGAARKRYDSIHSAALRAGYAGPFHDEGVAYATWMDSVYSTCYSIMAQVEAGTQPPPATTAALLALLPQCPFSASTAGA